MTEEDRFYMKRAIDLAREGAGLVSPNPLVGSVLVREGRVVGEGFHRYDLLKHAEVNALEEAGELARGATLYCSLEPCCHHGRTPPCSEALIRAGIARAVIAMTDPDPRVNGLGIRLLRDAGIDVEIGLGEIEARRLNEIYLKYIATGSPFVHAVFFECKDRGWKPSLHFSETASRYDALVFGDDRHINQAIYRSIAMKPRHRRLLVASTQETIPELPGLQDRSPELFAFTSPDELRRIISSWTRVGATSVLVFPFFYSEGFLDAIRPVDKATLIRSSEVFKEAFCSFDSIESEIPSGPGQIEVTGYPGMSG